MLTAALLALAALAPSLPAEPAHRPFVLPEAPAGRYAGVGVCYGPQRDGQYPGGPQPTEAEVREDLHILARHFSILRTYASRENAETVCRVIRADKLPLRLMVGAWIAQEIKPLEDGSAPANATPDPKAAAENAAEVATAIRLANDYPDVIHAINIGNEALVSWSDHRVPRSVTVRYVREARAATKVPVTVCDTELFWNTPESVEVSRECDFLGLHAYAMWNGQQLRESMAWTRARIAEVRARHAGLPIVLCETGWATTKADHGDQARLIKAEPNEADQELFFRTLRDWATEQRQPFFFFSAFDENWKGSNDPKEVEKHWGLYRADRTPKLVFTETRP